jgi:hypothetical protein
MCRSGMHEQALGPPPRTSNSASTSTLYDLTDPTQAATITAGGEPRLEITPRHGHVATTTQLSLRGDVIVSLWVDDHKVDNTVCAGGLRLEDRTCRR